MQRTPNHPGVIFEHEVLDYYNLSIQEAADRLGVECHYLGAFVNCRVELNCDLAVRIAQLIGSSPQMWMNMQLSYFRAVHESEIHVDPLVKDMPVDYEI